MVSLLLIFSCTSEIIDPRIQLLDDYMLGQAQHYQFNGNILIAERGEVIYQKSFGLSDFVQNTLLNDTTVFELASVSKQFTAMGILILVDQGELSLSDSLRSFFPELPYHNITVHHLLSHTSGLPDYMDLLKDKWDRSTIAFNQDMIELLAEEKPHIHFKPGEKWEYCNTAYVLMASIIEKVSGKTFQDYMAHHIFEPLQMENSRIYNTRRSSKDLIPNYAYGYVYSNSLMQYALPDSLPGYEFVYFMDGIQGDGITNSTTGDLLKWDRALVEKKLVSEKLMKEMFSPQGVTDRFPGTHYGYGVELGRDPFGSMISHGGFWPGYTTMMTRYIEDDKTIIVLSNNQSSSADISRALANIIYNKEVILPYEHLPLLSDTTISGHFAGSYAYRDYLYQISVENDSLYLTLPSGTKLRLMPESPRKIYVDELWTYDLQFEWKKDEMGNDRFFRNLYGMKEEIMKQK